MTINPETKNLEHSLITDPIFVVSVAVFAFLTTLMPLIAGMSWVLPVLQTLALFVFLLMVVRKQHPVQAIRILVLWSMIQLSIVILITALFPGQSEQAIANGFVRRSEFLEWVYAGKLLPDSLLSNPFGRVLEIIGITIGSLLTAGLLGVWLLVRTINLAGFYAGSTVNSLGSFSGLWVGLPLWTCLRTAAYIGFAAILAEPMLTGNWSIGHYVSNSSARRWILFGAAILLVASIICELALPSVWRSIFAPTV